MIKNYVLLKYKQKNNIVEELEFEFSYLNQCYYVESYRLDDENDMYSIRVYKTNCRELSDKTEVANAWLDSNGGGCFEENLDIYNENGILQEKVTEFIFNKLFTDKDKLIKPF